MTLAWALAERSLADLHGPSVSPGARAATVAVLSAMRVARAAPPTRVTPAGDRIGLWLSDTKAVYVVADTMFVCSQCGGVATGSASIRGTPLVVAVAAHWSAVCVRSLGGLSLAPQPVRARW